MHGESVTHAKAHNGESFPDGSGSPRDCDGFECEKCGGIEPEEVTGGHRCSTCQFQPAECACYEMTGGHQPGCAFNGRAL